MSEIPHQNDPRFIGPRFKRVINLISPSVLLKRLNLIYIFFLYLFIRHKKAFTVGPKKAFTVGPKKAFTVGPKKAFTVGPKKAFGICESLDVDMCEIIFFLNLKFKNKFF
jgi:hypothetical protein